jgi:hypothetical protein
MNVERNYILPLNFGMKDKQALKMCTDRSLIIILTSDRGIPNVVRVSTKIVCGMDGIALCDAIAIPSP